MSVQKLNALDKYNPRIEHEIIPFTQINTHVIQNIRNMEAGFVWVYLTSKPVDWKVIKEHLKNHFGIGDTKIKTIFSYLKKCNLIEYIQETTEQGKFGKSDIRILNGTRFVSYPQQKTAGSISARAVFRTSGSGALQKKENTKERKKREHARKKRAPLSEDFYPSGTLLCMTNDVAVKCNISIEQLVTKFKNIMKSSGKQSANWEAEFENFLINEKPSLKIKNIKESNSRLAYQNETKSTIKEYGPGHPTWEANREWELTHAKQQTEETNRSEAKRNNVRGIGVRKTQEYLF